MSHNKGKKYYLCEECKRKRYIQIERLAHYIVKFTCSKGHTWKHKQGPVAQIVSTVLEEMLPNITNLFERDSLFMRELRRRR